MTSINKIACAVYMPNGGAGVITFYEPAGEDITGDLGTFFSSLVSSMPSGVAINVPPVGETLDDATGLISGTWSGGTNSNHVGEGAGAYTAGVGASIRWLTAGYVGGRRVTGRTFCVPLNGGAFGADGLLQTATQTGLLGYADTLISGAGTSLLIWHRPVSGAGGSSHPVTSATVSRIPSWLRSRKV